MSESHLTYEQMTDLATAPNSGGVPTDPAMAEWERHLCFCAECAKEMSTLKKIIGLMEARQLEEPPTYVLNRVLDLYATRNCPPAATSLFQKLVAVLSLDSWQLVPEYGLRSGNAESRQLIYSAGDFDLDLRLTSSGQSWALAGQILGDCKHGQIELRSLTLSVQAEVNELCEFVMPPVPAGKYKLTLRMAEMEIEVPEIAIG